MTNQQAPPQTTQQQTPTVRYEFPAQKPTATYALLAITIFIFLIQQFTFMVYEVDVPAMYLMKINELIFEGEIWRLITPALVHADLAHVGFNMYALYIIGRRLERVYGHKRFLALYFLSAFAGNLFSFYLGQYASLGASTAIFGLMAAEGIYIYNNRKFFPQAQRILSNFIFILFFNLIYGLTVPSIDMWGHLGGFLGGLGFAWFAGPLIGVQHTETGLILKDEHLGTPARNISIIEFSILLILTFFRIFMNS